ncbi:MAG: four helix bundle protein [Bacteroidetes bacterium]|nr:four helix bundle protein [Bacteroidota bacterium]
MESNNILAQKTFNFSFKSIKAYQILIREKKEYILSKQLLRSATSIGANVEESIGGQSQKDFFMKLNIAYKEARECHYWLRLIIQSNSMNNKIVFEMLQECHEILRILAASIRTIRQKLSYK